MKLTIHDLHMLEAVLLAASPFYPDANGEIEKLIKKIRQMQMEEE